MEKNNNQTKKSSSISRRKFMQNSGIIAAAGIAVSTGGMAVAQELGQDQKYKKGKTVPLNWNEVWYTNCPMVSANNIDQELGWCREEFKKIGVEYDYFRRSSENDWYPHYIHNLDNLIRFGGLYPPIAVNADIRNTVLLGATWVYEGGCMAVRANDKLFRMKDLKGKKIGLSKSLNTIKNDWWRIQEHMGIQNMLMLNNMSIDDVEIVEFPYPDDWYDKPEMLTPINNPSELWLKRDHKHDLAFRPLETALLEGKIDAIYTQSKVFQHLQEDTGQLAMIEDLARYPDWRVQVANTPAVITCTKEMADDHPELVVAYMKAMIKVGRWANANKRAAAVILDKQTFYRDAEDTYQGIKHVDMVPSLNAMNMQAIKIGKDFMLKNGYIKNDFDLNEWAQPKFLEEAALAVLTEEWEKKSWSKLEKGGGLDAKGIRLG
jgi:ABC-type nitrate/sulfonate/bicarbonate transport system substrate-binding protein